MANDDTSSDQPSGWTENIPRATGEIDISIAYSNPSTDRLMNLYADWAESYDSDLIDAYGYMAPADAVAAFTALGGDAPALVDVDVADGQDADATGATAAAAALLVPTDLEGDEREGVRADRVAAAATIGVETFLGQMAITVYQGLHRPFNLGLHHSTHLEELGLQLHQFIIELVGNVIPVYVVFAVWHISSPKKPTPGISRSGR